ncbi:putative fatty acyl-CoA reductase CG8306 [Anopheles marshallii]|uniref:putative fatty acyl-CoA reductase CG8306 n=1 Tax=Anopheles marshallii TaxID=1521116 RepID=UPI00237B49B8|nr:putative fatty acyl-CoA reductase CG8306 [Anopheles marshallii]
MASEVQNFYKNKYVFLTGGTGFLGVAIIDKILRSSPEVGGIYLLMRPKKGKAIQERLQELTKNSVFEQLLESQSADIFKKLIPVSGDVGENFLGLSQADQAMIVENTNVVIHSAATLDFQATLRPTVNINLLGTKRVLELCTRMRNLKSMVHISSAYVNSYLTEAEEKLYPCTETAQKVVDLVDTLNDSALDELLPKLLKDHPNAYTFTKQLAEHEVNKHAAQFPCAIIRPSMITGAWKEPTPGWTISKNGPQGFLMGASKGVIRRLPVGVDLVYDYIPVDAVVNQTLVLGWYMGTNSFREVKVFHCTTSTSNPFKWRSVVDQMNDYLHKYPLKSAIWYPRLKFVSSLWVYKLASIFVHILPALVLDFILRVTGGRPMLMRLHTNVWDSLNRLEKFIFTEWKYHNPATQQLAQSLPDTDKALFNFNVAQLQWPEYFVHLTQGVRRYLNNEQPKSLDAARRKDKVLFIVDIVFQVLIFSLLGWLFTAVLGSSSSSFWLYSVGSYLLFNLL